MNNDANANNPYKSLATLREYHARHVKDQLEYTKWIQENDPYVSRFNKKKKLDNNEPSAS